MADPVDEVGAQLEQLDFITPEQSLTLMSNRIGRALEETERSEALKLAEAVGYLPIAMDLVAARVARKTPVSDLICTLSQEVARLEALSGPDRLRKEETRLEACFNLSLNALRDDDIKVWLYFVWLGVLPDDAIVAAPMAATLWDVEEAEAASLLELLWNDALLLPSAPIQVGERTFSAYRLHNLLHDVARRLLTTNQTKGLGIPLAQAHAQLLKRYRVRTQSDLWHTLADDGYIHARLSWHLEKAGWVDEIHKLLREETSSGRNGWHEACSRLGKTAIFVTDVAHAWRLAEDLFEDHPSRAISLQCRYALIVSTLNSLSANLPHSLLVAPLQKYVRVPKQGLAYALQSENPETKAILLTEIIDYLPQNLKEEALQEALAAFRAIQDDPGRVDALRALADKLPPELLPEALAAARAFRWAWNRVYSLEALADKLPEVLPEALADARAVEPMGYRADALLLLTDKLPEVLPEALAAARAVEDEYEWDRAVGLSLLADKLPEVLPEALAATRAIEDEWERVHALSYLADKLPPELLPELLTAARAIEDIACRSDALMILADKLPSELLPETLAAARAIPLRRDRANALSDLADKLPELLPEALAAARAIRCEFYHAKAMIALAFKLSKMQTGELFPLWQNTLHSLSFQTRSALLHDILALASVICTLGDRAAVAEVASAIQDVGRWWP